MENVVRIVRFTSNLKVIFGSRIVFKDAKQKQAKKYRRLPYPTSKYSTTRRNYTSCLTEKFSEQRLNL